MASVALCPRCSLESVIPSDADPNSWAQCPSCNALFQVKDAVAREVTELQLLDTTAAPSAALATPPSTIPQLDEPSAFEPDQTVRFSSEQTIGDVSSLNLDQQLSHLDATAGGEPEPPPVETPQHSAPTIVEMPDAESTSPDGDEAAARGVEKWFHSAKTVPDMDPFLLDADLAGNPVAAHDESKPTDAGPASDGGADLELDSSFQPSQSRPAWDDSEHMERLLAGTEGEPAGDSAPDQIYADGTDGESAVPATKTFGDAPDIFVEPVGRPRRRSSFARMLVGMVVFGIVGSAIGYYILLAVWGARVDFLDVAQYLPGALLPGSFSAEPPELADTSAPQAAVPARFEAESTADKTLLDDVAEVQSQEPSAFDAPDAAPLPPSAEPNLAGAPSYSVDQLAVALDTAKEAQPALMAGDLSDGQAVQRVKGNSFQLLCDLAEKATFVDAAAQPDRVAPLQQESDELFRQTLSGASARGDLARIADKWMGYTNRKNDGVFFAGTVISQTNAGKLVECQIDLGAGEPLTILLSEPLVNQMDASGRAMGFVGSIVETPTQNVAGYDGDATRAVWVGRLIALE